MESCEATNEPDSNEAVYYENIRYIVMCYCLQNFILGKTDPREHKDINAQNGWCWNKHEEVPIVSLQSYKHVRQLLVLKRNEMKKIWTPLKTYKSYCYF